MTSPLPERRRQPLLSRQTGFWLYAFHLFTVFGIALSNILLGLAVLTCPWTCRRQTPPWRRARPLLLAVGLYVLLLLVAIAASYEPATSLVALSEIFSFSTLVLALLLVRREVDVRRVIDGLILVAFLVAAVGLVQYMAGHSDLDQRIRGPFSHYMTFSGVLLLCDLLLAAQMAFGQGWRSPWRWLALVTINVALLGSYTRSAWVGLLVALTVLLMIRAPRWLAAYLPAFLLFVLLAPVPVLHRAGSIVDLRDISNYDRLCMAEAALYMVAERPLFGLGPELVERRYSIYRHPTAPRLTVPHLHNSYLQLAAERGLLSLGAYLLLMGVTLWKAYQRLRREGGLRNPRADLYLGVLLALLAFNVAGLFEHNWGDTEVQRVVLFLLAIPFALTRLKRGQRDAASRRVQAPLPSGVGPNPSAILNELGTGYSIPGELHGTREFPLAR